MTKFHDAAQRPWRVKIEGRLPYMIKSERRARSIHRYLVRAGADATLWHWDSQDGWQQVTIPPRPRNRNTHCPRCGTSMEGDNRDSGGHCRVCQRARSARAPAPQPAPPPDTRIPGGAEPGALESLRWDGLVTAAEVAVAFGVTAPTVASAVQRGQLTPAKPGPLFDPAKLARRRDGRLGPVDAGSEWAVDYAA